MFTFFPFDDFPNDLFLVFFFSHLKIDYLVEHFSWNVIIKNQLHGHFFPIK